jgi:hypothetical protein
VVFATDTTQNLDTFMRDVHEHDTNAMKELFSDGHLIAIDNGTDARILDYNIDEHAYQVRVFGSNHPVWVIEEVVSKK